jgi:hypothetical protein
VVVCAGEELKGNRCVLDRVPFFEAALAGGFREGAEARLEINDVCPAALRAVWHYIYTDDCVRIAELGTMAELMDALSLADRFALPLVLQASADRLSDFVPTLAADELVAVLRASKLHTLLNLGASCRDRIGEIGVQFLAEDDVCDLASTDRDLYKDIVNSLNESATKRRRTI